MEKPKSFWQECYENHYAKGMSRPSTDLVDEFNQLLDYPVFSNSVTARITAITHLLRFRGYNLSPLETSSKSIRLTKLAIQDGKLVALNPEK